MRQRNQETHTHTHRFGKREPIAEKNAEAEADEAENHNPFHRYFRTVSVLHSPS